MISTLTFSAVVTLPVFLVFFKKMDLRMVMLIVVVEDKISMIACAQHVLERAHTQTLLLILKLLGFRVRFTHIPLMAF